MKFTSEDLMIAMGLQVGDKIKYHNEVFTIVEMPNAIGFENDMGCYNIDVLLNKDFEILPRPEKLGELKCDEVDFNCSKCPIRAVCLPDKKTDERTLYAELELWNKFAKDQEIYDLLKARLDKEVEE